jgi:hypothetical protein
MGGGHGEARMTYQTEWNDLIITLAQSKRDVSPSRGRHEGAVVGHHVVGAKNRNLRVNRKEMIEMKDKGPKGGRRE